VIIKFKLNTSCVDTFQAPTASGRDYRLVTGSMKSTVDWILVEASRREQGHIIPGRSTIIAWFKGQNYRNVKKPNLCKHRVKLRELSGCMFTPLKNYDFFCFDDVHI